MFCKNQRMTFRIRLSGPADRAAILELLASARGDGLSEAEKAEQGFVQGNMDEALLARFQAGTGVFVAEEDSEPAGVAVTSEPGAVNGGPPKRAADVALDALGAPTRLFLYGPAAVDRRFQGRGVLTMLLVELSRRLSGRFEQGIAFVETANIKSLAVHRHYGMSELGRFEHRQREYVVFNFAPTAFAAGEHAH